MKDQLYFLGIIPPKSIFNEIEAYKTYIAKNYGAHHALRSPAHITVLSPFFLQNGTLDEAIKNIGEKVYSYDPFDVKLYGFDHFGERVIYVNVVKNEELAQFQDQIHKEIFAEGYIKAAPIRNEFHPHITIAFKDIKSYHFAKIWRYFFKIRYRRSFPVNNIHLLQYGNNRWLSIKEFKLKQDS
ncbi:MAG: 2'-5' RNA ligase family protein [Hyphomicrobiales bacterium]